MSEDDGTVPWPRYAPALSALWGVLLGSGLTQTILSFTPLDGSLPLGLAALGLGAACWVWWWFGIASNAACARRYRRARLR